jgi:hypothetical protein
MLPSFQPGCYTRSLTFLCCHLFSQAVTYAVSHIMLLSLPASCHTCGLIILPPFQPGCHKHSLMRMYHFPSKAASYMSSLILKFCFIGKFSASISHCFWLSFYSYSFCTNSVQLVLFCTRTVSQLHLGNSEMPEKTAPVNKKLSGQKIVWWDLFRTMQAGFAMSS